MMVTREGQTRSSLAATVGAIQRSISALFGEAMPSACTPLGTPEDLKDVIKEQDRLEAREKYSGSLMCLFAATSRLDRVAVLSEYGYDVNVCLQEGHTPLLSAVRSRDMEMVHLLLSKGANPDLKAKDRESPRELAKRSGQTRMVRLMEHAVGASYTRPGRRN